MTALEGRDPVGDEAPWLPARARIIEVGPRDGFQMERRFVPTALKIETALALAAAGLREIEVTSFVHPRVIPQLADAEAVMAAVRGVDGPRWIALVPNQRGARRALAAGAHAVRLVIAVTDAYNRRNVGSSVDESIAGFGAIAADARAAGAEASVVLGVALGCPIEGEVPAAEVAGVARRCVDLGAAEIGIADSYGVANPLAVRRAIRAVRRAVPATPLWMHLHDTRGMGLANALAALEEGVAAFDVAFGGLGGTPIMKGASGNIATEDLVYMLHEMGVATGVDLDAVRAVSRRLQGWLGRVLPSHVLLAGTREELVARNREADGEPTA